MKVVVSGLVWLDRSELTRQQVSNIRRMLTIYPRKTTDIVTKKEPDPIFLYEDNEERNLIGVPREFYRAQSSEKHEEIIEVSYGEAMQPLETRFKAEGPYEEQEVALGMLQDSLEGRLWGGVLLMASCGAGKTVLGLELARRLGRNTIIFVHKDFLLNQWKNRILEFMPDARVGIIKQSKCDYEGKDFVIALMQSLAKDDGGGSRYPADIKTHFGALIVDECHRVPCATFAPIVPRFSAAWRAGFSATPRRADGAQDVFFNHISSITYKMRSEGPRPKLRRVFTSAVLKPIRRGSYSVDVADLNSAQVVSQLAADDFRTRDVVNDIVGAIKQGRKIMVVSERLVHLKKIGEMLGALLFDLDLPWVPTIDYYTGDWFTGEVYTQWVRNKSGKVLHRKGDLKTAKRKQKDLDKAEEAQIMLCTKQMVEEALDVPALDVVVMATPMSDVEQMIGRVRRHCLPKQERCERFCSWRAGKCKGKPQPIVLDVIDEQIDKLNSKLRARNRYYKSAGVS